MQQIHVRVQTAAGFEDIYCSEIDDTKPDEVWFIFNDRPPRVFQRAAITSMQPVTPIDTEEWKKFAQKMNPRSYGSR
jgi:hypothetical protein